MVAVKDLLAAAIHVLVAEDDLVIGILEQDPVRLAVAAGGDPSTSGFAFGYAVTSCSG